jgi:hypothetical protein
MRAVIGIRTINDSIIATNDSIKPNPMKTLKYKCGNTNGNS